MEEMMAQYRMVETKKDGLIAIRIGFNWWACFFCFWWTVITDLKLPCLGTIVAGMAIRLFLAFVPIFGVLLTIGVSVLYGLYGNDWLYNKTIKKGGILIDTIEAKSKNESLEIMRKGLEQANPLEVSN